MLKLELFLINNSPDGESKKMSVIKNILNGGTGNDQLKGGAGVDVYQFTGIYGLDTINDSDGQGAITVGAQLMGGKKIAHNVYYNAATHYIYMLSGSEQLGDWFSGGADNDTLSDPANDTTYENSFERIAA
jgi:Ca2+-binding RTX toxin-like protein